MWRPKKLPPNATNVQIDDYCQRMNSSWINWTVVRWLRHWRHLIWTPDWAQGRRYFSRRWYAPDPQ